MLRPLLNAFAKAMVVFTRLHGTQRQIRITTTVAVIELALVLPPAQQQRPIYSNDPLSNPPGSENQAAVLQYLASATDKQKHVTYGWWGKLACLHVLLDVVVYLQWPSPALEINKAMRRWLHRKYQDQVDLQH